MSHLYGCHLSISRSRTVLAHMLREITNLEFVLPHSSYSFFYAMAPLKAIKKEVLEV
jgi:hypothetical protein